MNRWKYGTDSKVWMEEDMDKTSVQPEPAKEASGRVTKFGTACA